MPEGDTVFRTARRLHQALAGAKLTTVDLRWGDAATVDFTGRISIEVISRGKHLLHRVEGGWTIHSHLRMDGSWRILATGAASRRRTAGHAVRAVVGTAEWTCIGIRLGMLDVLPTAQESHIVGHLGPDILGPDWELATAVSNLRAQGSAPIGAALLDQRNLAGIGTMYAAETLFLQQQHPWTPVSELDESAVTAVVGRARRLLQAGIAHAVQSTTGSRRRGEEVYVHARSGLPCRRCGGGVRVAMIGAPPQDRTMFWCPRCQGGPAPGDDGRAQRPLGTSGGRGAGGYRRRSPDSATGAPFGRSPDQARDGSDVTATAPTPRATLN